MNSVILAAYKSRCFSISTSKASFSVPWISPLYYGKSLRPDPPTETSNISMDIPRKLKFISHDSAVNLMKREKDPLRDIFNRAGGIDEAINLLKEMEDKKCKADVVTFNVILVGLYKEGRSDEALCVLDRLFHEGVYLNKSSYRIVLNSLLSEGESQKATELLGMMLDQEFVPHFATSNELLVRLCEAGRPADAATVLCGLVEMGFKPEPEAWSLLIELMCRGRKLLATFQLMDGLAMGVNHE